MLTIKEIEKLSEEELQQVCDVSYSKDPKGKEIKIITYPKVEDYKISDEQIRQIASSISIEDVRKYIDTHREEYEEFLKSEKSKKINI